MADDDKDVKPQGEPSAPQGAVETSAPPDAQAAIDKLDAEAEKAKHDLAAAIVSGKDLDTSIDAKPVEPAKADPPPEPEPEPKVEPKAEKPAPHPYDEADDPQPEIDPKFTRIKSDFEKLRNKLRTAREDGRLGKLMTSTAANGKLNPEQLAHWVELGARANLGDPEAIARLRQILGAGQPPAAPATPAAPAAPDAKAVDATAQKIYDDLFKDDVAAFQIDEKLAREKSKKLAERQALSQPAPTQAAPPAAPPAPPQAPAGLSPMVKAALDDIAALEDKYAAELPNWKDLSKEVWDQIEARKVKRGAPLPATQWYAEYLDVVREVQAKRVVKPAAPVKAGNSLRPSTHAAGGGSPEDVRKQIAGAIMSGDLSNLE